MAAAAETMDEKAILGFLAETRKAVPPSQKPGWLSGGSFSSHSEFKTYLPLGAEAKDHEAIAGQIAHYLESKLGLQKIDSSTRGPIAEGQFVITPEMLDTSLRSRGRTCMPYLIMINQEDESRVRSFIASRVAELSRVDWQQYRSLSPLERGAGNSTVGRGGGVT